MARKPSKHRASATPYAPRLNPPPPSLGAALLLVALAAIVYSNSFQSGFVIDNRPIILNDPRVHAATAENLGLIFTKSYWWPAAEHGLYRPVTTLTYLMNYAVFGHGSDPAGYHWVNLILHAANTLLVYVLVLGWLRRVNPAIWAAAVWTVHPILTEAVTNIVGRADLLAATAVLGGLLSYIRASNASGGRRGVWLAALGATTCFGVFSKESAVCILAIVMLYEWLGRPAASPRGPLVAALAVMAVPLLLMWYQRSVVFASATAPEFHFVDNPMAHASALAGRLTAVRAAAEYLGLFVWPATLSADYSFSQIPVASGTWRDWIGWGAILMLSAVFLWLAIRRHVTAYLIAFAAAAFLPVSNLIVMTGTSFGERLMYLPSVGLAACAALGMEAAASRFRVRWAGWVMAGVIVAALGARTLDRNPDWHDDVSIWRAAAQASPRSFQAHRALAVSLNAADPSHANLTEVLAESDAALAILDPLSDRLNTTDMYADAGFFLIQRGDQLARRDSRGEPASTPESVAAYSRAIDLLERGERIDRAKAADYLAAEVARGRSASAVAPVGLPLLYERLAGARVRLGRLPAAIEAARHARNLAPLQADTHETVVWALYSSGRRDEAAVALVASYLLLKDAKTLDSLKTLYAGGLDRAGCALKASAAGLEINADCEIARDHLCRASAEIAAIYRWNRRGDLGEDYESSAARSWRCGTLR